jgi:hypothetical protein
MIVGLDRTTQLAALGWMFFGLFIYFLYAHSHSKLNRPDPEAAAERKVA